MSSEKCFVPLQRTDGKLVCPSCGGVQSGLRRLISHTWTCKFPKGIQPCAPGATPMNVPAIDNVPGSQLRVGDGKEWSQKGTHLGKLLKVETVSTESYGENLNMPSYTFERDTVIGDSYFSEVPVVSNSPKSRRNRKNRRSRKNRKNRTNKKSRKNRTNRKA